METQLPSCFSHDIFVSFEGETRKTFTDHLCKALSHAGFRTFREKDEMQIGHHIIPQLERAIERSTISIIVFTKSYGDSEWCLNELLKILERKKFDDHYIVFPIFYRVQPKTVRKQEGSFWKAFEGYKKTGEHSKEKIDQWRKALNEVSKIVGKVLPGESNEYESLFIEEIIESVRTILKQMSLDVASCRVGIGSRVKAIDQWLKDPADARVGVISGMLGVGKSTIAKVAYDLNFRDFDASISLDVRKPFKEKDVLLDLQTQLLSDISKKEKQIVDENQGCILKNAKHRKRILFLLDNVDQIEQVSVLLGEGNSFKQGSKIIITTSHEHLLSHPTHKTFKIKQLDDHESLRLFCLHAFSKFHPIEGYMELSERVVRCCDGRPLALQLFGSSLSGKDSEFWVSTLEQLEASPDERNRKTLEVGYKLLNDHDRRLFLTIASSFVGKDKGEVVKLLEEQDFYSKIGMQNLLDRSLVRVDEDNNLVMQRLVLDMARAIIRQETVDEPMKHNSTRAKTETDASEGKRKRAKDYEDESMPQNVASSSFKRLCLGFFSFFKPTTPKNENV